MRTPYLLFLAALIANCTSKKVNDTQSDYYNFLEPDAVLELEEKLHETSGLTWYKNQLITLQDEDGILFLIDPNTGQTSERYDFEEDGDYEGVCAVDEVVYAIQSDGDIFELRGLIGDKVDHVKKYKTGLDKDCEGLCYDPKTRELLIAEKEKLDEADREIFTISIKDLKKEKEPRVRFKLMAKDVENDMLTNSFDKAAYSIKNAFSISDHADILNPSGIAINPIDHSYYILSGTASILIILEPDGSYRKALPLPAKHLPQPEGIAFSPNGDLYISSEKAGLRRAQLVKYIYNEN